MGLMMRMNLALMMLGMLAVIGLLAIGEILGAPWVLMVVIAVFLILLQWAVNPYLIKLIFKIEWTGIEGLEPSLQRFVRGVCVRHGLAMPKIGVIHDNNPNAFCFGWSRNRSFLVLTDGISRYCTPAEKRAVVAHELGHIVHNDFVVMTIICMIPLIFYIIYKGCFESMKHNNSGNNKGAGAIVLIGIIALVIYVLTEFIVLLVSRYREYWADGFSAASTRDPNSLSSALVKIAYGLASEAKGQPGGFGQMKYENALMISDPRAGRSLAYNIGMKEARGSLTVDAMKEAMTYDMWNPWAKWLELKATHPLTAKRIMVLDRIAEQMGKKPYIGFDLKRPGGFLTAFILDVAAGYAWTLALPISLLYMTAVFGLTGASPLVVILSGTGMFLALTGLSLMAYLGIYRYPMGFKDRSVDHMVMDPRASPLRGAPVSIEGRVIGRGVPGLFFNEDLKLDDGTGIVLVDYHQVIRLANLFEGIFRTGGRIGNHVRATGWYRRSITPYIELYTLEWEGGTKKMHTRTVYMVLSGILGCIGIFIQLLMPLSLIVTGLLLFGYCIYLKVHIEREGALADTRSLNLRNDRERLGSLANALAFYHLVHLCDAGIKGGEIDLLPQEEWVEGSDLDYGTRRTAVEMVVPRSGSGDTSSPQEVWYYRFN